MPHLLSQWLIAGGAALIGSAAVRALPSPLPTSSRFYVWFYNFTQILAANYDRISRKDKE